MTFSQKLRHTEKLGKETNFHQEITQPDSEMTQILEHTQKKMLITVINKRQNVKVDNMHREMGNFRDVGLKID